MKTRILFFFALFFCSFVVYGQNYSETETTYTKNLELKDSFGNDEFEFIFIAYKAEENDRNIKIFVTKKEPIKVTEIFLPFDKAKTLVKALEKFEQVYSRSDSEKKRGYCWEYATYDWDSIDRSVLYNFDPATLTFRLDITNKTEFLYYLHTLSDMEKILSVLKEAVASFDK